ncbi:MAG: BNR-4 repeat-containing protein, partial [Gammaproteobacteria bacterium]
MKHPLSRGRAMAALLAALAATAPLANAVTPDSTARVIALSDNAFAGSSVNVLANVHQTLFTEGIYQYAAWYAADGSLTLAKRRLGEDRWEIRASPYKGDVKDAHNHIALAVDGAGYVHVAFDHHNNPLRYARGKAPGSIELSALGPM